FVIVFRRHLAPAGDPGIEIGIGRIAQPLEQVELGLAQRADHRIGEASHDQIHLAGAAMPATVEKTAPPRVKPCARTCASSHCFDRSPGPARHRTRRSYSERANRCQVTTWVASLSPCPRPYRGKAARRLTNSTLCLSE